MRIERDSLGELEIPDDAYWGINTARALDNFAISRRAINVYPDLLIAYAQVKQAAARANLEIGSLDEDRADLIDAACQEIIDGKLHDQFIVGVIQGGAGTSTNMNVNEVIANRALELGGYSKGEYEFISPNDHVNRSQSTNDTLRVLALGAGIELRHENVEVVGQMGIEKTERQLASRLVSAMTGQRVGTVGVVEMAGWAKVSRIYTTFVG